MYVHIHIHCNIFYTLYYELYDCNEYEAHERREAITLTSFYFLIELWVNFRVCFTSALCTDEILFIFMSFFFVYFIIFSFDLITGIFHPHFYV